MMVLVVCTWLLGACATKTWQHDANGTLLSKSRAQTQVENDLRVTAAVPGEAETETIFGLPLYKRGIQPVWLEIENRSAFPIRYAPVGTDRNYFSPLEVSPPRFGELPRGDLTQNRRRTFGLFHKLEADPDGHPHVEAGLCLTEKREGMLHLHHQRPVRKNRPDAELVRYFPRRPSAPLDVGRRRLRRSVTRGGALMRYPHFVLNTPKPDPQRPDVHALGLPVGGWGSPSQLILPAFTLGAVRAAYIARLVRTGMLDVLEQDFVRTARAKGLKEHTIVLKHVLRIGLLPVLQYLGPAVASILVGSVVVERIFSVPGLGSFFINAALNRDYTLAMGSVLLYSVLLISLNLIVDLLASRFDPRVQLH